MKPIIGITSNYSTSDSHGIATSIGAKKQEWQLLADDYIYSIEAAGGIPVVLPVMTSVENIKPFLEKLDGLVIAGGSDIDPKYYNQYPKKELGGVMPKRDQFEIELSKFALFEMNIPILGICRGCQVLNVITNGTLHQDMKYQKPEAFNHACLSSPKHHPIHEVTVKQDSLLHSIFGDEKIGVNSFHHQSLDKVGEGFEASMLADDQTAEGIELRGERFVVGLQWHPEMMTEHNSYYLKVFNAFIENCTSGGA